MKKITLLVTLLFTIAGIAQPPAGYYSTATGTGYTLKTQLHNIIKNHNSQSYNALVNTLYKSNSSNNGFRDHYYENDGTILDIYSERPTSTDPYIFNTNENCGSYQGEGDCYNREHLIPQSYFNSQMPMYSDAFHVWPTDGKVNGWRSNFPFGVVAGTTSPCNSGASNTPCHSQNGSKKGNNLNSGYSQGFSGTVFEPIDEFKGDVARAYFYFATRYQNQMPSFYSNSSEVKVMFNGTSDRVFSTTFLNILYQWHIQDPVSQRETDINNLIYQYQGNRNPYIDHPEWVAEVWQEMASVGDIEPVYVAIYPNPSKGGDQINITTDKEIEEIKVINLNGQIIYQVKQPVLQNDSYSIDNLPNGFYILNLNIDNQSVTKKLIVN